MEIVEEQTWYISSNVLQRSCHKKVATAMVDTS